MQVVLVLLGQGITDELIVCGTPRVGHGLHWLGTKASLEALYFLLFYVDKLWGILGKIVKSVHVLSEGLSPLSKSHELSSFHAH